jgi:hypothetical protein
VHVGTEAGATMRASTAFSRLLQVPVASVAAVILEASGWWPLCAGARAGLSVRAAAVRAAWTTDRHERCRWRHLDLGSTRCFLECELRLFRCPGLRAS